MFRTIITTESGASTSSLINIVGGHNPEPLLGDKDTAAKQAGCPISLPRSALQASDPDEGEERAIEDVNSPAII